MNLSNVIPFDSKINVRVQEKSSRVFHLCSINNHPLQIREATFDDIPQIQELYFLVYRGSYSLEFATNPSRLHDQIATAEKYLVIVAESTKDNKLVGSMVFQFDNEYRLGKAAGGVVLPGFRSAGIATHMLQLGVSFLTKEANLIDVLYATTRTINEAPSRLVADVGFVKMGIFPNAVQVENMEHLNLDLYFGTNALGTRRRKPFIFGPYHEVYSIAQRRLNLEPATLVSEFSPLELSQQPIQFELFQNEEQSVKRFCELSKENRLANSFFPFHHPNLVLKTADGSTEVFACMAGKNKQSAILGYRTDRTDIHDLLDSAAWALHRNGASYVEFLVDAYDYKLQQQAYTARFIPSAYFPAMRLESDGLRNDAFVLSRTFSLLDF